jgi:hypothetical protein
LLKDIRQHKLEDEQDSTDAQEQLSIDDSLTSECVDEKSTFMPSTNNETKQEGTIKSNVYLSYFRTGLGFFCNFVLILVICTGREMISIFSDRWLAMGSDNESHRYQLFGNCTNITKNSIRLKTNTEWNNYRAQYFYIYCGSVLVLFVATLFRVVITEFICLNAGRILHDK